MLDGVDYVPQDTGRDARFTAFVDRCRLLVSASDPLSELHALLADVLAEPDGPSSWLPAPRRVESCHWHDESLTIFQIHMAPGTRYPAHDHGLISGIAVWEGIEDHAFYRWDDHDGMLSKGRRSFAAGDVLVMDEHAIHSVAGVGDHRCAALHVYLGDLPRTERSIWHPETGARMPYSDESYFGLAVPTT